MTREEWLTGDVARRPVIKRHYKKLRRMPPLILPPKDAPLTVGQQRRNQRQFQVISDYFTGLCACSVIAAHVYCGYSLGNAISGSRIGGAVGGGLMLAAWILFLGKIS